MTTNQITHIETGRFGTITKSEASGKLRGGQPLNASCSQIVTGVYSDGRKTSLKGRFDGDFYFMSGNLCTD